MSDLIRFGCPACGRHLKIDERAAGKQVACPICERRFRVPAIKKINEHLRDAILDAAATFRGWGIEKAVIDPYLEAILNCPWLHWNPEVRTPYAVEDDDASDNSCDYAPPSGPTLKAAPRTWIELSWVNKCVDAVALIRGAARSAKSPIKNVRQAQTVLDRLERALFDAGFVFRAGNKWVRREDAPECIGPPSICSVLHGLHPSLAKETMPNQASDATSEPPPDAGYSAPQG